jgi:Gas vesicle protein G
MGLFTGLLTLPLAPVRGVAWVGQQVADEADRQLYDEANIRREMLQLELDYDDGKIDEVERQRQEEELLERMAVSHARRAEEEQEARAWEEEAWEEVPLSDSEEVPLSDSEEVHPSEEEARTSEADVSPPGEEVQGNG